MLIRAPRSARWRSSAAASNGGKVAAALADTGKRHFLEQEGLNAWGIWDFSQWDAARRAPPQGLRVRQAALHRLPALRRPAASWSPTFLEMYLPVRRSPCGSATRSPSRDPRRPAARAGLRPADQRRQGRRARATQVDEAVRGGARPAVPRLARRRPVPRRPGHLRVRRPGRAAGPARALVAAPRRAVRPGRHDRRGRHRGRAAGRDERLATAAWSPRWPATTTTSPRGRPSSCRRSRSASTSRAPAATARSRSAAGARPGRARSSAATCWCRRSPSDPRATTSGSTATSPNYSLYPDR